MKLIDLFIIGALIHFCLLGSYLVKYIERMDKEDIEK